MNIIFCCQKSVFVHTGSSFSSSRARWVLLSTSYIIIQNVPIHICLFPNPISIFKIQCHNNVPELLKQLNAEFRFGLISVSTISGSRAPSLIPPKLTGTDCERCPGR